MERLHGYENVDHVLRVLSEIHMHINRAIRQLGDHAHNGRRNLALGYLADHHSKRADDLASYRRDAGSTLLKQWFQIPFPEDPRELIESIRSMEPENTPIEEVIYAIDTFMDRLLQHMKSRAETRNVQALFADLLEIEDRERHLRSRALSSLDQI